ncbi:MAG: hypothetical protein JST92_21660 [Deltaproteobacteria bacterium]|nr:hypothetical protein [Deltaproteobacteria bacterium]
MLCRRVLEDVSRTLPEFQHIDASRILMVAGEARRSSRATVKAFGKKDDPAIVIGGRRALYSITLRPKFFRTSTAEERVATLLHELLHISPAFDGTLDESHRHDALGKNGLSPLVAPLLERYLDAGDPQLLMQLGYDGEVIARQWLERPTGDASRKRYTEKQLFVGPLRMITRRRLH